MSGGRHVVRPVDDVWLAMDQPDNLMVVEGLMVVDGELDRDTYVRLLRERVLDRFPRFRQRARARLAAVAGSVVAGRPRLRPRPPRPGGPDTGTG